MFTVAVVILTFIAFRMARITNESGGNTIAKVIASIFGLFVTFFGLTISGWRVAFDNNTVARLGELQDSGVKLTAQSAAWVKNSGAKAAEWITEPPLFADIPFVIFSAVILLVILFTTWGPQIKYSDK